LAMRAGEELVCRRVFWLKPCAGSERGWRNECSEFVTERERRRELSQLRFMKRRRGYTPVKPLASDNPAISPATNEMATVKYLVNLHPLAFEQRHLPLISLTAPIDNHESWE
jgi:hypothetical protein